LPLRERRKSAAQVRMERNSVLTANALRDRM
jgi:hypothetical protein